MYVVQYYRHFNVNQEQFEEFEEAVIWIDQMEEHGQIYAASISDERGRLWSGENPFRPQRWVKVRDDAPDWPVA